MLVHMLFLENLTATLGGRCHYIYVTDTETEADKGKLDDLPKATELECKAGHIL